VDAVRTENEPASLAVPGLQLGGIEVNADISIRFHEKGTISPLRALIGSTIVSENHK
jgi:hypothetical protein